MLRNKYLKILSLLLVTISLTGCKLFGETKPEIEYIYIEKEIPIQERPRGVRLHPVYFHAVSERNLDEFLEMYRNRYSVVAFFAISPVDYENLSLNVAELRRYIEQQQSLILYYESNIMSDKDN